MKNLLGKIDLIEANEIFLLLLCSILLMIIVKKMFNKRVPRYLRLIPLYIGLIIFQLAFGNYIIFSNASDAVKMHLVNISAYFFTILEYVIFSVLLSNFIRLKIIKNYLRYSCFVFTLIGMISWPSARSSTDALSFITSSESISLIPFCLYYFFELLNIP